MTQQADAPTSPSWSDTVASWIAGSGCDALTAAILAVDAPAVAWECAPVARDTQHRPFRCVVLPRPGLDRAPADRAAFADHFGTDPASVVTFGNLGGDATLVVPTPAARAVDYPHLSAFLRRAPRHQIGALWAAVGHAVLDWWATRPAPVWVSTAGGGVAWLHVRLDARPKYYRHDPFRTYGSE